MYGGYAHLDSAAKINLNALVGEEDVLVAVHAAGVHANACAVVRHGDRLVCLRRLLLSKTNEGVAGDL